MRFSRCLAQRMLPAIGGMLRLVVNVLKMQIAEEESVETYLTGGECLCFS